ncbi:7c5bee7e-ef02-4128-b1e1-9281c887357d [Thermothielavioides terrestris]|uniref:7c5bee7e-ef02-4128-b1e1-9281c887357d n=1 Tax=Thermothielavioides terrestris TaxID=2587410 RepID=A0A3S4AN94_9PEZI|nr:7c5bee7e-ef02-4128-b1e1-9281c887357d [Thermothielavioides terrestris]
MASHLSLSKLPRLLTLLTLFSAALRSSALQVTPNSPCSSACLDSPTLDASDPNSSNTRNSDITCKDADYSSAAGTKFKNCMTCLQNSTFSQGQESDIMWFLYNLRYTASYCLFGFPNATNIGSNPCATSKACGSLQEALEDGIPDPRNMTAYSYCSAGGGEAMASSNYDLCLPCVSADGTTTYLANYFVALEAGCQQQPAPGVRLGLNDTVFSSTLISIVDPATLGKEGGSKSGLSPPAIVGIVIGAVAVLLLTAACSFVCFRRRRNRRAHASAEADFFSRFNRRHHSSMSFQCQTHMVSPRFWPGAEEGVSTPFTDGRDAQPYGSAIAKSQDNQHDNSSYASRKAPMAAAPLQISTTVPLTPPPQAYTSPSYGGVHSSSALLPSIRPYVPAEHGVHVQGSPPPPSSTFSSPTSGTGPSATGMTPLLKSSGWPLAEKQQQQQEKPPKRIIRLSNPVAPPPPTPLRTSRSSGMLAKKSPKLVGTGSPVESREIQTAFAAPPKR